MTRSRGRRPPVRARSGRVVTGFPGSSGPGERRVAGGSPDDRPARKTARGGRQRPCRDPQRVALASNSSPARARSRRACRAMLRRAVRSAGSAGSRGAPRRWHFDTVGAQLPGGRAVGEGPDHPRPAFVARGGVARPRDKAMVAETRMVYNECGPGARGALDGAPRGGLPVRGTVRGTGKTPPARAPRREDRVPRCGRARPGARSSCTTLPVARCRAVPRARPARAVRAGGRHAENVPRAGAAAGALRLNAQPPHRLRAGRSETRRLHRAGQLLRQSRRPPPRRGSVGAVAFCGQTCRKGWLQDRTPTRAR